VSLRGRLAPSLALAALAAACGAPPASTPPAPPAELAPPVTTASANASSYSYQPRRPRAGTVVEVGGAGRLAADQVQRIVRRNYGLAMRCYVDYVRTHRQINIMNWVDVDFTIDRRGVVSASRYAGGNLPDRTAIDCLVLSVLRLDFDAPEGGPVEVRYRFTFTPE
jgi:hypothetical protein